MGLKATDAQQRIFEFVEKGTGNGIIDAVAGAGKTTTLMGCVMHIPNINDVIYCAFNTSIQKELHKKFHEAGKDVKVCTIHSLGYQMLRAGNKYTLRDNKYKDIIKNPDFFETLVPYIDQILGYHNYVSVGELRRMEENRDSLNWEDKNALNEGQQYVHKIMNRLLDINQKYRCTLEDDNVDCYDRMIRHFSIIPTWECECTNYRNELQCYFLAHQKLLKDGTSMAVSHGIIDYTDQIYLPKALNLSSKKKYGFVFVDECQDLSKAQLYVVKQYLREDGRLLAVGDPYQAIYGFAGADCESFERVKKTFNCQVLGLTDCFRCPQTVIQLAKSIRPDINGFKTYPGNIYKIKQREVIVNVKKGDLIICRTRRPLLTMALKLIMKDYKVKIHPDELEEFMGNYKSYFTSNELRSILTEENVEHFFERIRGRNEKIIIKENNNADTIIREILIKEEVADMEDTLHFLKSKFFEWQLNTLQSILTRLKNTLSYPGEDAIRISTIHRAKGLENDRVFILEFNKLPYKRDVEWEIIQERNLHYVAVTRPKEELYLCYDQTVKEGDEDDMENVEPAKPVNNPELELINQSSGTNLPTSVAEEITKEDLAEDLKSIGNLNVPAFMTPENDTEELLGALVNSQPYLRSYINLKPIQRIARIPAQFYSLDEQEDTPYHALNERMFQKAKYWSVYNNLQDTEYSISNVVSLQYRDDYMIATPNGVEIYNGTYNNNGQYTFRPQGNCVNADQVMCYLTDELNYKIKIDYKPQNFGFEAVHEAILAACKELGICNTNIYSENYVLVYCFKTSCSYAYVKLTYNGKNIITTVTPFSTLGESDDKLTSLLEILQHLWHR